MNAVRELPGTHLERSEQVQRYMSTLLGAPFWEGNDVQLLFNGDQIFPAMLKAIDEAEHDINFLTFVYWTGDIAEKFAHHLADKAREGINVRVLLDAYGAFKINDEYVQLMQDSGVEVRWFRPFRRRFWHLDNRTHRKVLVCDNRVGFTGGVGIAKEWEGNARNPNEWRDTHLQIIGPAVDGLNGAFWDNWLEVRNSPAPPLEVDRAALDRAGDISVQVVRSSSGAHGSEATTLIKSMLTLAQTRLRISTPYFVLDDDFCKMLCETSARGVEITLMVPGQYCDKSFENIASERDFDALLSCGIQIYRYQKTMMHQKLFLVDDVLAVIGSVNFNQRSLKKDEELAVAMTDPNLFRDLSAHFEEDLGECERITSGKFRRRSIPRRVAELLMRPFREQL